MCLFNEVIYLFEKIFQNFPVFLYDFTFQTQFSIFFFENLNYLIRMTIVFYTIFVIYLRKIIDEILRFKIFVN